MPLIKPRPIAKTEERPPTVAPLPSAAEPAAEKFPTALFVSLLEQQAEIGKSTLNAILETKQEYPVVFTLNNITRGANGRIISATITVNRERS